MSSVKLLGAALMLFAAIGAVVYSLWFFDLIPGLDSELAVRLPVLLITLFIFLIIGWLGYVMATTTRPAVIKPQKQATQSKE